MMMLTGAGWVSENACGAIRRRFKDAVDSPRTLHKQLAERGLLSGSLEKAGRFDVPTRRAFCAAALALHDACFAGNTETMALIGTGTAECEAANINYFSDFAGFGRQMGRANLFIYTLPTSPLAEIAIQFKLGGPLFFTNPANDNVLAHLKSTAGELMRSGDASAVLSVWAEKELTLSLCWEAADAGMCAAQNLPNATTPAELIHLIEENL